MSEQRLRGLRRWSFLLFSFVLLAVFLLVGSCALPTPEVTPEPTPTLGQPSPEPTAGPPTAAPLATATSLPLPPPQLLDRSPASGEAQPLDEALELTFDQPMDQASVEAALIISPTIEGAPTWRDDRTVAYAAEGGWLRGARYEVSLADTARNAEGTSLPEPVAFEFSTVGYLTVTQVIPAPDSKEVDPGTTLTVVFDRPVVPLTAINRQAELPDPLTLVPPVRGSGEWLNTAIYLFRPAEGLLPATEYKARIAAGLTDTTGGVLAEDYTWEFVTLRPAVLDVRPVSGFQYVGPTEPISVTFNQPMDHTSVEENFSLQITGQGTDAGQAEPVSGTFRWSGAQTQVDPETMVYLPDEPLSRGTRYIARLADEASAATGSLRLQRDEIWRFTTVEEPGVLSTSPEDGATDVDPEVSLNITFASPMQRQGFLENLTISPRVTNVYTYWTEYDTSVQVAFQQDPATAYSVRLDPDTPDKYGAPLGPAPRIRYTTGDLEPFASLQTGGRLGTSSTYTKTVIYAAHRNVSRLEASLYRLSPATFLRLNRDWDAWEQYVPAEDDLVRAWSQQVTGPPNEVRLARLELVDDDGDPLSPGLYYACLDAPELDKAPEYQPSRYMFVKSRLNLALKQTRSEVLLWATDLATGQPIAGLPVTLGFTTQAASGTTDRDGLFVAQELQIKDLWQPFMALSGEPGEEDFGVAFNGWDQGINPWDFDIDAEFWASPYQAALYTDRPIYRPGQTVYFKGILRADDDARYSLPSEIERVEVRIGDPQGRELYRERLDLSDMGTLYDELALGQEAPLGSYYIEIQDPGHELYAGTSFLVAEYRKPEFEVAVTTDRDEYLAGVRINARAEATYYFGGGVADAEVHWSVLSNDHIFRYQCPPGQDCPPYSWTDFEWGEPRPGESYGGYGRLVAEGEGRTDEQGTTTFAVPADIEAETGSQVYTLEASVMNASGQQVSNRTAAIVHKGEFYVGVAPRNYLGQAGEETAVDLLTVDWEGQPVPDVPLTVTFMEHRWYSVRRQAEDGGFYWDWMSEDIPVITETVTTDDQGQGSTAFTPDKAGSYKIRAVGYDRHENEIHSAAYLWVWGGDEFVSWRRESTNRIELVADKQAYEVGDVAEILIPSPYTGTVQALVTVERGHILESEVRELETNSEVLRLPITEEHVPNIFVSVIVVQGAEGAPDGLATFKMGVVKLPVSLDTKELDVRLTPDKNITQGEQYAPRQTARYEVLVHDHEGQPVEAELSLRMADLAVLALADEPGPTLLETFWRSRGLGVRTSMPLAVAMERFNRDLAPGAKGGGGGEEGGLVRSQFADTAFWDPVVRTGEDGQAEVTVQLPDNLTTWRMQARAITADTLVGQAETDIVSTLDLLVRPVLPRFFVVGDKAEIASVIHNNTEVALETEVQITAEGLAFQGETDREVRIPPGETARVVWPVEVLPMDEVTVRMWAQSGDLYDGREDTLPIYHYATPEVVATAGQISEPGIRQEIIQLPRNFDPSLGGLTVQIDGSLAAATQDALRYLEHYPYECVEQTVSRFLPNVVTWAALEEFDLQRDDLKQKLSQMVGTGLQQLYTQQHYDGGWGWWVSDQSDPYLTAYVLQGLLEAHDAGFVVDPEVMDRAASFVRDNLLSVAVVETAGEANRLAYQLYVLAEYNETLDRSAQGELGLAIRLFEKRHLLGHYGRGILAVALGLLEPDEPQRVEMLLNDLAGDAVVSATGTHWEETEPDYWNMNTDIRSTAVVLWALARLEPNHALLPGAVRWLMAGREEGHWGTTQNTAWSLLGLVAYMHASGELEGDYSYAVYLNGEELVTDQVTPESVDESRKLQVEIERLLTDEANRLVIERQATGAGQTGEGQLYYSARLHYYVPASQVQALDRGIMVARQYSPVDTGDARAATTPYADSARVGEVIRAKLTIIAPKDLYYVVVEDPFPAGFEGLDLSLKTASVVGERPELRRLRGSEEEDWYEQQGWGWWWFSHSEMRDEKAVLFAQYLPRGTYEYSYLIQATLPGEFSVIPTSAYQMYFPEVFGRSDGATFTVLPAE